MSAVMHIGDQVLPPALSMLAAHQCGHSDGACLRPAGDAFNMRHPLTGGGMTVALSDAQLLCDMLRPLPDFSDALATARTTAAFYTRRKPLSATINTLANALYRVRSCSIVCSVCCRALHAAHH